jgi:hypothetical protein
MYDKNSPYSSTGIINGHLDILNFKSFPFEKNDILFEVTKTYEHRPDLLAYDLYQEPKLWWVFAVRNRSKLKDPVFDLKAGVKIYIPKITTLKRALGI